MVSKLSQALNVEEHESTYTWIEYLVYYVVMEYILSS